MSRCACLEPTCLVRRVSEVPGTAPAASFPREGLKWCPEGEGFVPHLLRGRLTRGILHQETLDELEKGAPSVE